MLKKLGFDPKIIKPNIEESISPLMNPMDAVLFLSLKKALCVEEKAIDTIEFENPVIIAADTIVFHEQIIGKPSSKEEAYNILNLLNGKWHEVVTGVSIIQPRSLKRRVFFEVTRVKFKSYSFYDINEYISTDEPYDKAGGYAIQGNWAHQIDKVEGSHSNVIGLPIERLLSELDFFKVKIEDSYDKIT